MNIVDATRNLWLKNRVKYENRELYGYLINVICKECSPECEMQEECRHFQTIYIQNALTSERLEHKEEL